MFLNQKFTISNIFIGLSLFGMILLYIFPSLIVYGINDYFLEQKKYLLVCLQFFTASFLHAGMLHFFFNSIFIYYFGNLVEVILGQKKYLLFFLFSALFTGIFVLFFSSSSASTVGISGFCMALMSFYTLELRDKKNPEWTGGVTAIIVNVAIGFGSSISLSGHLFGAISGVIFYYIHKEWMRRKMIGMYA